jgi:hypothetical protein
MVRVSDPIKRAEKSAVATRRQHQAGDMFNSFLTKVASEHSEENAAFPVTEEVADASVHLKKKCWYSFRKRVEAKGCKSQRREITMAELVASKEKRTSKRYVISVTCPVHPGTAERKERIAALTKIKPKE